MPEIDAFIDYDGWAYDVSTAVEMLSERDTRGYFVRKSLVDLWPGVGLGGPESVQLEGKQALMMMRTTEELQRDLDIFRNAGVQWISIPGDMLAIYYARRLRGGIGSLRQSTETLVVIAPAAGYWGLPPMQIPASQIGDRTLMYPYYVHNGGISLATLRNEVIPVAGGEAGTRY